MSFLFGKLVNLSEAIHVHLADEGGELAVPEVVGKNFFLYFFWTFDQYLCAIIRPANERLKLFFLRGDSSTLRISQSLPMN